jgi:hypothetical protein
VNLGVFWGNLDTLLGIHVTSLEIWGFWRGIYLFILGFCGVKENFEVRDFGVMSILCFLLCICEIASCYVWKYYGLFN